MTRTHKKKLITIIVLTIVICGMSIGMAAFSATLNISSTAKVNPNSEDFNIKVYGFSESMDLDELINNFTPQLLSDTISMPNIRGIGKEQTFNPAKISNNKNTITISDIQTQYKNTFGSIEYYFIIQNEGKYNATIAYSEFQKYFDNTYNKECVYDQNVNSDLAEKVCENMKMHIALAELDPANELLNSATGTTQDFNTVMY